MNSTEIDATIALNRFGLGARPDEPRPSAPREWLLTQARAYEPRPTPIANLPSTAALASQLGTYLQQLRMARARSGDAATGVLARLRARPQRASAPAMTPTTGGAADSDQAMSDPVAEAQAFVRRQGRENYATAVSARARAALTTKAPFVERLVHFWSNHFAVSIDKFTIVGLAGAFEFDAIRPHVLGNFYDLLLAVERHPAMLLYLDQAQSIGPNSMLGRRAGRAGRDLGLNENLAREILELHTLGVRTGYSQADVTELARALTGWTVAGLGRGIGARIAGTQGEPGSFVFADRLHEPGERTILGKKYDDDGVGQAASMLYDLAHHPATARHVATKLARHFAGDDPPAAMIARVEATFLGSGGDLPSVYRAIVESPECWDAEPRKFKTPWEWSVSAMRAVGLRDVPQSLAAVGLLNQLGHPVWRPGSPAGFDDIAASWVGPDAVLRRVEVAQRFADRIRESVDARTLGAALFPGGISATTAQQIMRAETSAQALALLLVSPEFLRR